MQSGPSQHQEMEVKQVETKKTFLRPPDFKIFKDIADFGSLIYCLKYTFDFFGISIGII